MFRKPIRAATAYLTLAVVCAALAPVQALAWPFASKPETAGKIDPNAPVKATPEQRAAASRLSPLVRATFWEHESRQDPTDAQAGIELAYALRALGKYDEAADAADRVVAMAPKNLDGLIESARDHVAAGHGFYAIQPLKQAMLLSPRDWRPVSLMGVALEQDERPDDALASYYQALKLSPDNPAVLSNLALFWATRNDVPQAESLLRRAAAQPQATAQIRQNLALILGLEGKATEAERWMRQDLPPEAADSNLIYVQGTAVTMKSPAAPTGSAAKPVSTSPRTWGSVQTGDPKGD